MEAEGTRAALAAEGTPEGTPEGEEQESVKISCKFNTEKYIKTRNPTHFYL